MYMFHGGTNFGFLNGAEPYPYAPITTSYDYDAPLNEAGDPTPKYYLIRDVIAKYAPVPNPAPQPSPKGNYGVVSLNRIGSLFLPAIYNLVARKSAKSAYPKTLEELGENYGFVHYSSKLRFPAGLPMPLTIPTLHDAAQVFVDGLYQGAMLREQSTTMQITVPKTGSVLDLLVENLGRINFGPEMENEYKGIKSAQLAKVFLSEWSSTAIPLRDADVMRVANLSTPLLDENFSPATAQPSFFVGYFDTPAPAKDTFLSTSSWTKGIVWINGFNLGRYWCVGPQATLYVPAPVLRTDGPNQIILFDNYGQRVGTAPLVNFVDQPQLDSPWC